MQEELITFETAKLAKEKGFNIECLYFYTKPRSKMFGIDEHGRSYPIKNKSKSLYVIGEYATLNIESVFYAPTQSLLQRWFREKHKINVIIEIANSTKLIYYGGIYQLIKNKPIRSIELIDFKTYEEALEAGLQEALKLLP